MKPSPTPASLAGDACADRRRARSGFVLRAAGGARRGSGRIVAWVCAATAALTLAACSTEQTAVQRGDRLWADSDYAGALSEYRLALSRHPDDVPVLARVAHAYARSGRLPPAREAYDHLLQRDSSYRAQAVFDYLRLAHEALARGDSFGMASAVEAALALRPGLPLKDFASALARYYSANGDPDRAMAFFERALGAAPPDSAGPLLWETGLLDENQGSCRDAIGYFQAYVNRAPKGAHADEARWHIGNCAFELARREIQAGQQDQALDDLATTISLGVPQNLLDQAWFQRGEILLAQGRRDEALEAYMQVLQLNPARTGQLVQRAQRRIDEIRFGGPLTGTPFQRD